MAEFTSAPWWADRADEVIVIRGSDGDSICAMKRQTGDRLPEEQEANAEVIALAPELFHRLQELVSIMRRSDPDYCAANQLKQVMDDEWDAALEDAETLIELAQENGVSLGERQ